MHERRNSQWKSHLSLLDLSQRNNLQLEGQAAAEEGGNGQILPAA
jgi:hypothetical protein